MSKSESIIKNTKAEILNSLKSSLQVITETGKDGEVYFHDVISNAIDTNTPQDRKVCLDLIDKADSSLFDTGLIDNGSIDRVLITSAYCSIEQILFNDDFIQELQTALNNETINRKQAERIIKKIERHQEEQGLKSVSYGDNSTQIFLKTSFNISIEDFKPYVDKGFLTPSQLINLSDSVKVLTSNKDINQNAVVIEEKSRNFEKTPAEFILRVYLMQKNKEIDIRNFFKLECISAETGFNLSPSAYIEQTTEQYEQDKLIHKYNYLKHFKKKEEFIKQIVRISQKLTALSMGEKMKTKNSLGFAVKVKK